MFYNVYPSYCIYFIIDLYSLRDTVSTFENGQEDVLSHDRNKIKMISLLLTILYSIDNKGEINHNLVRLFFPWVHIEDILAFTPTNFKTVPYREIAMKDFKIKTENYIKYIMNSSSNFFLSFQFWFYYLEYYSV